MKTIARRDLLFLLPLAVACVLAFYRFPLFQYDEHLSVISEIYQTGRWPAPDGTRLRMAHHPLAHHTLAALTWKAPELIGLGSVYWPESAQVLSLIYALGTALLVARIVGSLVPDPEARRMAYLVFGTFTGFVISAVTVSNDMAMAFWGTAALLQAVRVMRQPRPPSSGRIVVFGVLLGLAVLMKVNALAMIPAAVFCLISRRRYYGDGWAEIGKKTMLLTLTCLVFYLPAVYRFPETLGINPNEATHLAGGPSIRHRSLTADMFTLPLAETFRRPFAVTPGASYVNRADRSFWTGLFISKWSLPSHLPDPPNPYLTVLFFLTALFMSFSLCSGAVISARSALVRPEYFAVLIWILIFVAVWIVANLLLGFPVADVRYILFSLGSQVAFLALGWQTVIRRWPRIRKALWALVVLHTVLFFLILSGGPFYYFHSTWPNLTSP